MAIPPGKFLKYIGAGAVVTAGSQILWPSETFYNNVVMPTVHQMCEPEAAHRLAVKVARYGLLPKFGPNHTNPPALFCDFLGHRLNNPFGIAAGFDKNGEAISALEKSGIGFLEIGSVTPRPQPGNDKPRVFRLLEDRALINRYGFNSDGVGVVSQRVIAGHNPDGLIPLAVNLGKNKDTEIAALDYEIGCNYFANSCEFLVINLSSPNTPGLRALQSRDELIKILDTVKRGVDRVVDEPQKRPKIIVKITCDVSDADLRDIARVSMDPRNGVDALIISNTTVARPGSLISAHKNEMGGLSGPPLRDMSTECIRKMYKLTKGTVPIIGCGGVESGADAYEKIRAGASLVQFYTALVYQGFPVIGRVKRELAAALYRDGFTTVSSAVGADHRLAEHSASKSWWQFW